MPGRFRDGSNGSIGFDSRIGVCVGWCCAGTFLAPPRSYTLRPCVSTTGFSAFVWHYKNTHTHTHATGKKTLQKKKKKTTRVRKRIASSRNVICVLTFRAYALISSCVKPGRACGDTSSTVVGTTGFGRPKEKKRKKHAQTPSSTRPSRGFNGTHYFALPRLLTGSCQLLRLPS